MISTETRSCDVHSASRTSASHSRSEQELTGTSGVRRAQTLIAQALLELRRHGTHLIGNDADEVRRIASRLHSLVEALGHLNHPQQPDMRR
jgi:hypothetical protein